MASDKIKILIAFTIVAMIGVFYLLTIREGHNWGGDFSMYIHHAKNMVEGTDYKATGYIYNPFYPSLGPKTCPPVFPVLLSPIYNWFGLNLSAMKIEIILIFLIFLLMVFLIFRNELPFYYLVTMIAIIGFNPHFWDFKDNILSDIPFLFFAYPSLLLIHQAYQSSKSHRSQLLYAILVGLFIYLSYGTRSIGIVLIPCLLIYDIIRCKRPTPFAVKVTILSVFLIILQNISLHGDSSYLEQLAIDPKVISSSLFLFAEKLSLFWFNGYSEIFRYALFVIVCGLATVGYLAKIKDGITIFEIFPLVYVVALSIWPVKALRFLIPVIPLYIFYAFVGIRSANFFQRNEVKTFVFTILIVAIFVSYAAKYMKIDYGPIGEGISKKESIELLAYVRENTKKGDVFIFQKPRVLSLFTGRSASIYHQPHDDKDLWNYFCKINATYIIVGQPFYSDRTFLRSFIERYKNNLREVYSNPDFEVYKIKNVLRPNSR